MNGGFGIALKALTLLFAVTMLGGFVWYRQAQVAPKVSPTEGGDAGRVSLELSSEDLQIMTSSKSIGGIIVTPDDPTIFSTSKSVEIFTSTIELKGNGDDVVPVTIMPGSKSIVMPVFSTKEKSGGTVRLKASGEVEIQEVPSANLPGLSLPRLRDMEQSFDASKPTTSTTIDDLIREATEANSAVEENPPSTGWPEVKQTGGVSHITPSAFSTSKSGIIVKPDDLKKSGSGMPPPFRLFGSGGTSGKSTVIFTEWPDDKQPESKSEAIGKEQKQEAEPSSKSDS